MPQATLDTSNLFHRIIVLKQASILTGSCQIQIHIHIADRSSTLSADELVSVSVPVPV